MKTIFLFLLLFGNRSLLASEASSQQYQSYVANWIIEAIKNRPLNMGSILDGSNSYNDSLAPAEVKKAFVKLKELNPELLVRHEQLETYYAGLPKTNSAGHNITYANQRLLDLGNILLWLSWVEKETLSVDPSVVSQMKDHALLTMMEYFRMNTNDNTTQPIAPAEMAKLSSFFSIFDSEIDRKIAADLMAEWQRAFKADPIMKTRVLAAKTAAKSLTDGIKSHLTPFGWGSDYRSYGAFFNVVSWLGIGLTVYGTQHSFPMNLWAVPGLLINTAVLANIISNTVSDVRHKWDRVKFTARYNQAGKTVLGNFLSGKCLMFYKH